MNIRPHRKIKRKKTKKIQVGNVSVGGDSIISVQSMTNTLTTDVKGTINQILELKDVGADIVRVSCPDENSTKCLKEITRQVDVPIVADIHFHHKRALEAAKNGASCLRINPGNIGSKSRVVEIIKAAKGYYGARRKLYGVALQAVEKASSYAYRDRRQKKRDFRRLWIIRINAAVRNRGLSYSKFIALLSKNNIEINRKNLAYMAVNDSDGFTKLVDSINKS